jgi:hypothetical protein
MAEAQSDRHTRHTMAEQSDKRGYVGDAHWSGRAGAHTDGMGL